MAEYNNIQLAVEGHIAIVTIARPKALNALNTETLQELAAVFTALDKDAAVRAIILTGDGPKSFVAGADITEMAPLDAAQGEAFGLAGHKAFDTIEQCSKPVIAAVNGFALGGGCEIAMACDIRIAATNALFAQPEAGLGIPPGFGGTQRLPRLVGRGYAKLMILSCLQIKADEALRIGLVEQVVAPEELMPQALKIAAMIATKSPNAVRICKRLINEGLDLTLAEGNKLEAKGFGEAFNSPEQKEGMAAFVEKRKANF